MSDAESYDERLDDEKIDSLLEETLLRYPSSRKSFEAMQKRKLTSVISRTNQSSKNKHSKKSRVRRREKSYRERERLEQIERKRQRKTVDSEYYRVSSDDNYSKSKYDKYDYSKSMKIKEQKSKMNEADDSESSYRKRSKHKSSDDLSLDEEEEDYDEEEGELKHKHRSRKRTPSESYSSSSYDEESVEKKKRRVKKRKASSFSNSASKSSSDKFSTDDQYASESVKSKESNSNDALSESRSVSSRSFNGSDKRSEPDAYKPPPNLTSRSFSGSPVLKTTKFTNFENDAYPRERGNPSIVDASPSFLTPVVKPETETERIYYPALQGCRSVEEFACLNRIEEGTYGVVYRAKDKKTGEIVALKRLKMEKEKEGFPITSLREINTLLKAQHENVVTVREIVVGSNMDKIYIVMDYVEHDLKSLMQYSMKHPFLIGEVKTLMVQLLRGVEHLHNNWIVHRDLKTSNLLFSHKGILKIGDFGLAREYGSPLKPYTPVVVTLWYRAPELLLGTKLYTTTIDMWSVGCIFGELLLSKPLFPGKSEIDELNLIFKDLGTPSERIWPGYTELPGVKKAKFAEYPYNTLRSRFGNQLSDLGFDLLNKFLTYDPKKRITAEAALKHPVFLETPLPIDPSMFPTWPARSEGGKVNKSAVNSEPRPPSAGKMFEKLMGDDDGFQIYEQGVISGFSLKF